MAHNILHRDYLLLIRQQQIVSSVTTSQKSSPPVLYPLLYQLTPESLQLLKKQQSRIKYWLITPTQSTFTYIGGPHMDIVMQD